MGSVGSSGWVERSTAEWQTAVLVEVTKVSYCARRADAERRPNPSSTARVSEPDSGGSARVGSTDGGWQGHAGHELQLTCLAAAAAAAEP